MIKTVGDGVNSLLSALLILAVLSFGLVSIQWAPIWVILRNVGLAALGEATPGLTITGNNKAPVVECDNNTGKCQVVE